MRNPHVGFGVGKHFYAGAHVGRLELEMAFKYLLPRIDEIELAGPADRLHANLGGGIKRLPIRYSLKTALLVLLALLALLALLESSRALKPEKKSRAYPVEPVTQALLGAATAEWVAGKSLGHGRALGWGAIIGMSPDLDVLLGPLRDGYGEWLYHRGTTHSLWFGFVAGPALGGLLRKWRDPEKQTPLFAWIALATAALVTHPLLDGFTPYGTQFFAPFSRLRFAWNGVAIVDPIYSLLLGFGVFAVASSRFKPERKRRLLGAALITSTLYLLIGVGLHQAIIRDLESALQKENPQAQIERVRAYPTIFQPWLRSFVARTNQGLYTGLHSWQEWDCPSWRVHPAATGSTEGQEILSTWEGELLNWFADGDVGVFKTRAAAPAPPSATPGVETVRLEDLRYGWASANARGMWGIEARFENGRRIGPITRIPRPAPTPADASRILRLLRGRLPDASGPTSISRGRHRPKDCIATGTSSTSAPSPPPPPAPSASSSQTSRSAPSSQRESIHLPKPTQSPPGVHS